MPLYGIELVTVLSLSTVQLMVRSSLRDVKESVCLSAPPLPRGRSKSNYEQLTNFYSIIAGFVFYLNCIANLVLEHPFTFDKRAVLFYCPDAHFNRQKEVRCLLLGTLSTSRLAVPRKTIGRISTRCSRTQRTFAERYIRLM